MTLGRAPAAQEGLANVCLVGASTTLVKAKVEASMPRKRGAAAAGYDKALASFFDKARPHPPRRVGAPSRRSSRPGSALVTGARAGSARRV